jgi:hypothetical protein
MTQRGGRTSNFTQLILSTLAPTSVGAFFL